MEELGGASQLRPYGVLRPLESGPQIRVFLLQSGSSAEPTGRVLTLIPSAFQQRRDGLRAVERLYNLRSQTEHPLLPEIRGIGFRGRCAGMVTAFLEHPTLYETVGGWSLEQRLEAAQDILLLLRFLHRRSMHGGWLSPAKIFCRDERVTTVNLVVPSEALAGSCPSPRSLRYCAPEVLEGGTPDPPSDSYSAGMLLYFILTGREPFSDSSEESIRRKQIAVNPTPARILCSGLPEFCQVLIDGMIRKRPRDRFSVDQALHFLSENTSRSRWHVPALSTPMIGRRREYERLQDLIERFARKPRPLVALVSGPAGIGKSFLTEQLEVSARTRHLAGLHVAHRETDGAFEAFRHGAFCDPCAATQGVPAGRVRGATHSGRRIVSWLLENARQSPLVIRATDLQWLDEGSLEIYRHTLCDKAPILLLGDCRSDEPCPYWKELCGEFQRAGILHELRLGPLSNSELREILHSALGTGWPEAWLDQVTRISAGNPFHLKELLGFLKDSGQLRYGSLGWYGRHLSDSQWEPPLSVSGGLQARIERVTGRKRAILDHLTVLDRPAELDLLARILDRDPRHLLEDLRELETLGFVEIEGNLACPVLALSHRWLEAVLAQNLPIRSRKRIHRRILRALLALTPAQSGARSEELARHSIGAQSRQKACKWTRLAVSELKQDRLFRQASVLFERALDEGCLSPVRWTDVRTRIDLLFRAGEYLRCEEAIRAQLAGRCSRSRLPYLWTMLARVLIVQGSLQEAGRLLEQAHSSLEDIPAFRETAAELLACLSRSGELQKARHLAAQLLQAGGTAGDGEVDGKVAHALFQFFRASGLQGEAVHWSVRSIRAAARMEDAEILARRCLDLGELHLDWGRGNSAEGLTRYGAETATRVGHSQIQWQALLNRVAMANRAGRISVAERCFREWRRQTHRHPSADLDACFQIQFALSALCRLQLHQAERSLAGARRLIETSRSDTARRLASVDAQLELLSGHPDRVIEIARRLAAGQDPLWQATGGILVAEGLLAAGDRRTAGVEARRAGRLLHRVGPRLQAQIRLLQGRVALAEERPQAASIYARAALETARAIEDFPLLAAALALRARSWNECGVPEKARVVSCRALQILRQLEAPLLKSRVLCGLAEAEIALSRPADGERHFGQALELLRAPSALFEPQVRAAFSKAHIEPLERRMARLLRRTASGPPRRLVRLTEFATALTGKRDPVWLARNLLQCLEEQLGISAGSFFWTNADGGIGSAAASTGRCRFDAHSMVREAIADQGPEIQPRIIDGTLTLMVPLDDSHGTAGWLYVEKVGPLPEVEFDLLGTVKAVTELALSNASPRARQVEIPTQIRLRDGRVLAGRHPQVRQMMADLQKFAETDSTVLICGESGTGKELIARAIHEFSRRRNGPFIAVNCASFATDLIESQLFGHARGAFTGATDTRIGFFEAATRGTLFLDEISSMPRELQPRLLRVLQERKIFRLGEISERKVDARVLAATNCDLKELSDRGAFRPDLFHRLNVLRIDVPALRERSSDVPVLTRYFLEEICDACGLDVSITSPALELLKRYPFPGNVRELRNLLESLAHTCSNGLIEAADVEARLSGASPSRSTVRDQARLERIVERMAKGQSAFWSAVRKPFLERELARRDVIHIVSLGLDACGGNYRRLVRYFGLADSEYKKFLNFLSHHDCKVDFRQFRRQND